MSDANAFAFGKFIPGFDLLRQWAGSGASAAGAPGLKAWLAPTVNPEELDKRIQELKAVLFWLEQNSNALKATIQALEVQKLTLATLQGMNLSLAEVAKAFTLPTADAPAASRAAPGAAPQAFAAHAPAAAAGPVPEAAGSPAAASWPFAQPPAAQPAAPGAGAETASEAAHETAAEAAPAAATEAAPAAAQPPAAAAPGAASPGLLDPMQWWGALTQQFQHIAAQALRDTPPAAPATAASPLRAAKKPRARSAAQPAPRPAASAKKKTAPKKSAKKKAAQPARSAPARPSGAAADWPLPPPAKPGGNRAKP